MDPDRKATPRPAPIGTAIPRSLRSRRRSCRSRIGFWVALGLSLALPYVHPFLATAQTCPEFFPPVTTGTMQPPDVNEASGMVASVQNPGVFWVHNDSGDTPRAFAVAADGALLATVDLSGIAAVDWEDMARGPGPTPDIDYLYFGDIGDNLALRASITVYRVPEPVIDPQTPGALLTLPGAVALEMTYPAGAHDAETLLSDPATGALFVVTKCLLACDDGISRVFRAPFPHDDTNPIALTEVATIAFPGGPGAYSTTAGDISAEGDRIAIRTYTQALWWPRADGETVAQALAAAPCPAPVAAELQGETLAFSPDGASYTSVSEFAAQPMWRIDEKRGDQTLRGSELRVKDRSAGADPAKRRILAEAIGKKNRNSFEGDPLTRGAVLEVIANGTNPTAQSFVLLPGLDSAGKAFWKSRGKKGFRYRDALGEQGPVEKVALRRKKSGKFSLEVEITAKNGPVDIVPPADGTDGFVTLRIPGGDRYCVHFGAEGRVQNDGAEFWRVRGVKEQGCP